MDQRKSGRISPMRTQGTQHLIERAYRESGPYQWVRETLINAIEAGATRIEYGIEWQAVQELGVYRRVVADNGRGMTAEELVEFFNTFGGSGKPIGGVHENFGVGAKTSLMPWNKLGVVVISWVHGQAAMIWVQQDPDTGEYGLKLERAEDPTTGQESLEEVVTPYADPDHGCDWAALKPDWIEDHGTVIVLLGNSPDTDTVLGDASREEGEIKGISTYLNRRIWEIPDGVEVYVDELRGNDRASWPPSKTMAHGPQQKGSRDRRTNKRAIRGARYYVQYENYDAGSLAHSGSMTLRDETKVLWYLWEGERPRVDSYAAIGGYIAALYRNELYDVSGHPATYRSFGIGEAGVRRRLWLVIEPPILDEHGRQGVYPRTDRNALLLKGGPNAGGALPFADWGEEFADRMPDEIRDALRKARTGADGTLDDSWRDRLAERFGSRWRIAKLRAATSGSFMSSIEQPGSRPAARVPAVRGLRNRSGGGVGGTHGGLFIGSNGTGPRPAKKTMVGGGIPTYITVRADDMDDAGWMATWQPNHPEYPEGVVLINVEHPVLRGEVARYQSQFPDHRAEEVAKDVISAYGEIAVAKVAHSEHLKAFLPSHVVERDMRSNSSLTMALLGLVGEEAYIAPKLGGRYGRINRRGSETVAK
jgi:hypothetical protein